jgi:transcriptional regulator with XRE-family HTH domain
MVSGFRQKKIDSIERVGEILRAAREKKGDNLAEISRQIQVREINLHNLEEGYYDNLPAEVYTKGFLRTYANYLGLKADKLVRMYEKEAGIKSHLDRSSGKEPALPKKVKLPLLTPRFIKIALIVAVVAVAVSYLGWQFSNFSRTPKLIIEEPANDITISENSIVLRGQAERQGELTINGQGVFVTEDETFSEKIALKEGLNTISVVIRDRRGHETSLTRRILVELPPKPVEENSTVDDSEEKTPDTEEDLDTNAG